MTVGKQKRDFMQVARAVVEQAIGEQTRSPEMFRVLRRSGMLR
jgi:hypothetical protein